MKTFVTLLLLLPVFGLTQMSFEKSVKKLGIETSNVIFTKETITIYPRGFIYDRSQPDSVFYFGCISSDQKDFTNYFEQIHSIKKLQIETTLNRIAGEYVDAIKLEHFEAKQANFYYSDSTWRHRLRVDTKFVVLYYWNTGSVDKNIIKNYLFFVEYANKHPELGIEVLAVCTDKLIRD